MKMYDENTGERTRLTTTNRCLMALMSSSSWRSSGLANAGEGEGDFAIGLVGT